MARASRTESEAARILDPLGVLLRELTRLAGGADDGHALTATQRIALLEIFDGGPLRLSELTERMGTSAATASRAVDALVHLELVERVPDAHDRRAVSIDLTPPGRATVEERKARAAAVFAPAAAVLSARETAELVALLERMTEALSRPGASATTPSPAQQRG